MRWLDAFKAICFRDEAGAAPRHRQEAESGREAAAAEHGRGR